MNPDLDDRLNEAAPSLDHTPDLQPAIADLVEATRLTQPRRRRPGRRGVLISTTTAGIVLAGTATAAALGFGGWETPWGKDPVGAIAFTLPSGVECEFRIGNFSASSPGTADELRSWLDDHTLDQITDIDATLKYMRAEGSTYTQDDGTEVAVGYGTPYYDANVEYFNAVQRGINNAILDRAEETGIMPEGPNGSLGHAGELNCADGWEPTSTWLP